MFIVTDLIKINSITQMEAEIQGYILNLLTSNGHRPLLIKGNIVLRMKGVNPGKCLVFNSHVDTVPAGDFGLWKQNPFSGFESGGKIYGLGASDNKASVAVLLMLAQIFAKQKPECDVILTFTIGEEVDGHGTNDTVKWLQTNHLKRYKNISAIVCEPTGLSCIGLAHKGNIFLKIITKGKSGHGSKPLEEKDHSVFKMYKIVVGLQNLNKKWAKKYKNPILGAPTIGLVTSIKAGDAATPNKFPETCSATFDIRTVPEMHNKGFAEIKKAIGKNGSVEYQFPPVASGFTEKNAGIAKVFKKTSKAKFVAFPGSSDMPFFTQIGIPTVIFGPGEMEVIHKPNEYCYPDKVEKCVDIFKRVVKEYNDLND